jgi:hypothetical protein
MSIKNMCIESLDEIGGIVSENVEPLNMARFSVLPVCRWTKLFKVNDVSICIQQIITYDYRDSELRLGRFYEGVLGRYVWFMGNEPSIGMVLLQDTRPNAQNPLISFA